MCGAAEYPDFSGAAPSCHEPASKLPLSLSQRWSPFRPTLPPLMRQILAYAGKDNPCCPLLGRRNILLPGEVKGRIKDKRWSKEPLISHPQLSLRGEALPSVMWTWRWGGVMSPSCRSSCFNNLLFTVIKKINRICLYLHNKNAEGLLIWFSQTFSLSLADGNKLKEKTWFRCCVGRGRKEATLIKGNKTCTSSSFARPLWHSWVLPGLQPPEKGKLNFSAPKLLHWAVLNVMSSYERAHEDIPSSEQLNSHENTAISKAMNGRGEEEQAGLKPGEKEGKGKGKREWQASAERAKIALNS